MAGLISFQAVRAPQFDSNYIRAFLLGAMRETATYAMKEFEATTSYWKGNRPKFDYRLQTSKGSDIEAIVFWDNIVYSYLDKGVGTRRIPPNPNKKAAMAGTYSAGSLPGTLTVRSPQITDERWINLKQEIVVPPIEARNFSGQIKNKIEVGDHSLQFTVQRALERAAIGCWRRQG